MNSTSQSSGTKVRKRGNGKTCADIEVLASRLNMLEKSVEGLTHLSQQIAEMSAQMNSIKADLSRLILHVENPASAERSLIVRIKSVEDKLSSIENTLGKASEFARQVGVRLLVYFIAGMVSGGATIAAVLKVLAGH